LASGWYFLMRLPTVDPAGPPPTIATSYSINSLSKDSQRYIDVSVNIALRSCISLGQGNSCYAQSPGDAFTWIARHLTQKFCDGSWTFRQRFFLTILLCSYLSTWINICLLWGCFCSSCFWLAVLGVAPAREVVPGGIGVRVVDSLEDCPHRSARCAGQHLQMWTREFYVAL
jgi:hypothetical protein